jgi:hypothetical protein
MHNLIFDVTRPRPIPQGQSFEEDGKIVWGGLLTVHHQKAGFNSKLVRGSGTGCRLGAVKMKGEGPERGGKPWDDGISIY